MRNISLYGFDNAVESESKVVEPEIDEPKMFIGRSGRFGTEAIEVAQTFVRNVEDQDLKKRLDAHLIELEKLGGLKKSELDKIYSDYVFKGQITQTVVYMVTRTSAATHKNYESLAKDLDSIPEDIFVKALDIDSSGFALKLLTGTMYVFDRGPAMSFLLSYALTFMSVAELLEFVCKVHETNKSVESIGWNDFIRIVESQETLDWREYPLDWIANSIL